MPMRVLALDISTKAGWSVVDEIGRVIDKGLIRISKQSVLAYGPFPTCYYLAANEIVSQLMVLVNTYSADKVAVEMTNSGKNRFTQLLLDSIHCLFIERMHNVCMDDALVYVDSSAWRSACGLTMTKEQKKANAKLSKAKRESTDGTVDKKALGIKGKVTVKHLSVHAANQRYNLDLKIKDNDIADSLNLAHAIHVGVEPCDGT